MTRGATHRIPGLALTEHRWQLPLRHAEPDGEQIEVFARELVDPRREHDELPWLLFLQGGPGLAAPRPLGADGWIGRALRQYRVLLLDQRGTGRSTPLTAQTLARFADGASMAEHLRQFRADAIVRDAELIRRELIGDATWSVLGQSFGGFCALHDLSAAPGGLTEVVITGGLPPLQRDADEVYRATYRRVIEQNHRFFARYPEDAARAQAIVNHLLVHEVVLPSGAPLSPRRFQQLGHAFGASTGFEQVHYLLEQAFVAGAAGPELSQSFLWGVEAASAFGLNPLYAVLHEAIYCQGAASRWSAERVRGEFPAFAIAPGAPVLFSGEMVFPWMFDEYPLLRPLKQAAEILAADQSWPALYDSDVLRRNTVPVAAVIYTDDMYVERRFSEETAAAIGNTRVWITNEYQHDGLRANGEAILDRLLGMLRGMA